MSEKGFNYTRTADLLSLQKDLYFFANKLRFSGLQDRTEVKFMGVDLANNALTNDTQLLFGDVDFVTMDGLVVVSSSAGEGSSVDTLRLRLNRHSIPEYIDIDLIPDTQNSDLNDVLFDLRQSTDQNPYKQATLPELLAGINDLHQKRSAYYPSLVDPREEENISLSELGLKLVEFLKPTAKKSITSHIFCNSEFLMGVRRIGDIKDSLDCLGKDSGKFLEVESELTLIWNGYNDLGSIQFKIQTEHPLFGWNTISGKQAEDLPTVKESLLLVLNAQTGEMDIKRRLDKQIPGYLLRKYDTRDNINALSVYLEKLLSYKLALADNSSP